MAVKTGKLLFVYNADSGLFNTVSDIAHKILSPSTYACNLCALTHGHFRVRDSWVRYLEQKDTGFEFLHRDEFIDRYGGTRVELPAIFSFDQDMPVLLYGPEQINALETVEQLIALLESE